MKVRFYQNICKGFLLFRKEGSRADATFCYYLFICHIYLVELNQWMIKFRVIQKAIRIK